MSACICASPRDGLCGVSQYISCLVFPVGQTTTGRGGGGGGLFQQSPPVATC